MILGDLRFSPFKPWKRLLHRQPEDSTLFRRVTFQETIKSPDRALTADSFVEQPSTFASLVEDVVVCILCFCDIAGVLSISEVSFPITTLPSVKSDPITRRADI